MKKFLKQLFCKHKFKFLYDDDYSMLICKVCDYERTSPPELIIESIKADRRRRLKLYSNHNLRL